ncbi:hypothetical protein RJ639_046838, partial [Escallonia herrerae]
MADHVADKAKAAFVDDDFQLAADLYTQAIGLDPDNPDYYADRAQAHIKLNYFTEAVADANKAIELDPLMTKAYLRKGTACFKLEEYHAAKAALEIGASLVQNDSRFSKLIKECDEHISGSLDPKRRPLLSEKEEIASLKPNLPANVVHASVGSQPPDASVGNLEEAAQGHSESGQKNETELVKPSYSGDNALKSPSDIK